MGSWVVLLLSACLFVSTAPIHSYRTKVAEEYANRRLECFSYLKNYMPPRDVNLTDEWLYRHVDTALIPWYCGEVYPTGPSCSVHTPWVRQVPWDIYLNDILPYARCSYGTLAHHPWVMPGLARKQ